MKLFFPLLIFLSFETFCSGQVINNIYSFIPNSENSDQLQVLRLNRHKRDTIPSRIQLVDLTLTDLAFGNFNLNYERSVKTKHSIETGVGIKFPVRPKGEIPVIPALIYDPIALEYIGSSGYSFDLSYKRTISRKNFGTYIGIKSFYRNSWFRNKLEDLSYDGTSDNSHLYWESVFQKAAGLNLIFGKRIFSRNLLFMDMFCGTGLKIIFRREIITKDYDFGSTHYYDPPKEYTSQRLQPSIQIGLKIGFFKKG